MRGGQRREFLGGQCGGEEVPWWGEEGMRRRHGWRGGSLETQKTNKERHFSVILRGR